MSTPAAHVPARKPARTRAAFTAVLVVAGAACAAAAWAQPVVWRCDAGGTSRYSGEACDGGRPVAVADARSAEQVRQAQEVAQRERRLLAQLVAERKQREREATGGAAGIGHSPSVAPKKTDRRPAEGRPSTSRPGETAGRATGRQRAEGAIRPARPAA